MRNLIILAGLLFTSPAWCDILVDPALDDSTLNALRGETVTYSGVLTNLSASVVYLNGCQINIAGSFTHDCSASFLVFAPLTLAPQEVYAPSFNMFTVTVDLGYPDPNGPVSGTFDVLGGLDDLTFDVIGSAPFTVNVVPEPGTWLLALAGGVTVALQRSRRLRTCGSVQRRPGGQNGEEKAR
jgi:hypothetical protein